MDKFTSNHGLHSLLIHRMVLGFPYFYLSLLYFTGCHECNAKSIGECFIHGKVIAVTDNKLPSRARLSLPSILVLKKIKESIPGKKIYFQ